MDTQKAFFNSILFLTLQDPKSKIICMNSKKYNIYIPFSLLQNNINPIIPISQRSKDSSRVDSFVEFLEDEYKKTKVIPDLNNIHICLFNNRFYLIDGQHRYSALTTFFEKNKKCKKEDYYLMPSIYFVENKKEMKMITSRINNIFVSEEYLVLDEDDNDDYDIDNVKTHIEMKIKELYGNYISESTQCRIPRFHLSHFKDYIFDKYPKWNAIKILDEIEKLNKEYGQEYQQHNVPYYNSVNELATKKNVVPFYLSKIINEHHNNINPKNSHKRIKVSAAMRASLWNKYYGDETNKGTCILCKCELKMSQYHVSHIQSLKENGTYNQDNLTIMCSKCNTSLGSKNLNDYLQEYGIVPTKRYIELNNWKVENKVQIETNIETKVTKRVRKKREEVDNQHMEIEVSI